MIPFLSRKCRAFALDNNEKTTGEPTTELLLNPELKSGMEACNGAKVDTLKNGTLVDEDEDDKYQIPPETPADCEEQRPVMVTEIIQ